jgi:hypothetical protein
MVAVVHPDRWKTRRHERLAVLQQIRRGEAVGFSDPMWLASHHVDSKYVRMLPSGLAEISAEEAAEWRAFLGSTASFTPNG